MPWLGQFENRTSHKYCLAISFVDLFCECYAAEFDEPQVHERTSIRAFTVWFT